MWHGLSVAVCCVCISSYIMAAVSSHPQTVRRLHCMCLRHRSTAANPLHQHTSTLTVCSLNSSALMRQISLSFGLLLTHMRTHKACVYVTRNPRDLSSPHLCRAFNPPNTLSCLDLSYASNLLLFHFSFPPLHPLSCLFCSFSVFLNVALHTFMC